MIGVTGTSKGFFERVAWPEGGRFTVMTHADDAGSRYRDQILCSLGPGALVRLVDTHEISRNGEVLDFDETSSANREEILLMAFVDAAQFTQATKEALSFSQACELALRRDGANGWLGVVEDFVRVGDARSLRERAVAAFAECTRRGVSRDKTADFVAQVSGADLEQVEAWLE